MRARRKKELKQKASATRIIRNFNTWETFWKPLAIRWLLILYLAQFWTYIDNFATWQIFIDVNGQILNKKFVLSHCLGHFRDHHLILPPPFDLVFAFNFSFKTIFLTIELCQFISLCSHAIRIFYLIYFLIYSWCVFFVSYLSYISFFRILSLPFLVLNSHSLSILLLALLLVVQLIKTF